MKQQSQDEVEVVVLGASGCEMIANVRRSATPAALTGTVCGRAPPR